MTIRSVNRLNDFVMILQEKSWKVNLTAVSTDAGVVVIDSFPTPYDAGYARNIIEDQFRKRVVAVINTHHHYDHVLGNQAFAGADIYAHRRCRERMEGYRDKVLEQTSSRSGFESFSLTIPTMSIDASASANIGGTIFNFIFKGSAHTDCDIAVHLPQEGILVTGDIFIPRTIYPINLNSGSDILNWINILESYSDELRDEVIHVVPGHLEVSDFDSMLKQADYLRELLLAVDKFGSKGGTLAEACKKINLKAFTDYNNYARFNSVNVKSAWTYLYGKDDVSPTM